MRHCFHCNITKVLRNQELDDWSLTAQTYDESRCQLPAKFKINAKGRNLQRRESQWVQHIDINFDLYSGPTLLEWQIDTEIDVNAGTTGVGVFIDVSGEMWSIR